MNISNIGLSSSAFSYACGFLGRGTPRQNPSPLTLEEFIDFAHKQGLGGVEITVQRFIPLLASDKLNYLKQLLEEREIFLVVDSDRACDSDQIKALLSVARELGNNVLRIKSSKVLGCNRKQLGKPWNEHIQHIIRTLRELSPIIKENHVKIAIENHQDLDSRDLGQIIESVGDDIVGVNFDIGNAFSTYEDPMIFAKRLGSSILNIHIKDYKIYKCEGGYMLVRCPLGAGAVDFVPLFEYFKHTCPQAKIVIELGALEARYIRCEEADFWEYIQPRADSEKEVFREIFLKHQIRADDDSWTTPWEKDGSPEEIVSYEIDQHKESIDYLRNI